MTVGAAGCSTAPERTEQAESALAGHATVQRWPPASGPITIPVCFVTDPPRAQDGCTHLDDPNATNPIGAADIARVQRALESSWAKPSRVQLDFQGICDRQNDASEKVVIWIYRPALEGPPWEGTKDYGYSARAQVNKVRCPADAPTAGDSPASIFMRGTGMAGVSERMDHVAVHEFGHLLGFFHENEQPGVLTDPDYDPQGNCSAYGTWGYPTQFFTPYDPDSVMNYCRAVARQIDGRLSESDVEGLRAAYGDDGRDDADGDGVDDYADNCPYVVNGDQADSNFEAEKKVQMDLGFQSAGEGERPTWNDPSYVPRWHEAYKGDACDPVATTRGAPDMLWVQSKVTARTVSPCWSVYIGGAYATKNLNGGLACPLRYSTGMRFESQFGGPAGLSAKLPGTSAPSFCECPDALSQNPIARAKCQAAQFSKCYYADDSAFPPLDGTASPSAYKALTREQNGGGATPWAEVRFDAFGHEHVNPMPGFLPRSTPATWAVPADLPSFALSFPQDHGLVGIFWTRVTSFDAHLVAPFLQQNLKSSYVPMHAEWDYGARIRWIAPVQRQWWRIPYCDPSPRPRVWMAIPHMVAVPTAEGGVVAVGLGDDPSGTEIGARFGATATAALALVATGAEVLVADDRVSGQPGDALGPNAVVVDAGTTRIRAAFVQGEGLVEAVLPSTPVGTQTTAPLRAYAAREARLYSLEGDGKALVARDVVAALQGQSALTEVELSETIEAPRAMAYSRATRQVYVLAAPVVDGSVVERLLRITPASGAVAELWRARPLPTAPSRIYLSTTVDGEVLLSQSGNTEGAWHALLMDAAGHATASWSASGDLHSAVVGHAGALTALVDQPATEAQPNVHQVVGVRPSLSSGACGSSWLRGYFAPDVGVTGALLMGAPCE